MVSEDPEGRFAVLRFSGLATDPEAVKPIRHQAPGSALGL